VEALEVVSDGHRLNAGVVVPENPRGLVVLLHGIPSISPPEPGDTGYPGLAERFAAAGWAALWVDMRAVRGSEGHFSIEGWVRDLQAVLDVRGRHPQIKDLPTVVVGSSAGGAVAATAVNRGAGVRGLALLAAPASWVSFAGDPADALRRITEEAGMTVAPDVIEDPIAWADEFQGVATIAAIGHIDVPVLIVHGTADSVVPVQHAHLLAEAAPDAELRIIEGAEHQVRKEPAAVDALLEWMEKVLA
jgi:alpha-beta hydrolase superfamily lysophospholipase